MNVLNNKKAIITKVFVFGLILGILMPLFIVKADTQSEISTKQQQIEEIQRQIEEYQKQISANKAVSSTLQVEISRLNNQISQISLEIRSLELQIGKTGLEISSTENKISEAISNIDKHKNALVQYIKIAYENDQKNLTEVLLSSQALSDFFNELNNIRATQDNLKTTIGSIRSLKADLEVQKTDLEDQKNDMLKLKYLQEVEKGSLDRNKNTKNTLLRQTKGEESKYQELVKKSERDIQMLNEQISYLRQNGVSVEDAIKYGQMAAIATGIRPAFLIAILEIESRLGKNVGTGNWIDDMYSCYQRLGKPTRAEQEKNAFLKIVNSLGLNPDNVKVSAEPNYGCGGALGPAQFLPTTWLGYVDQVARLTGHNPPNPWNIEDAFMASSLKLAAGGANSKTREGEIRAAKAYISGNPSCTKSICYSYSNMVLRKADEIEPNL